MKKDQFRLESCQKNYIAHINDHIVGIIIDKKEDGYAVDINSYKNAYLPSTEFEGATRRN